MTDPYLVRKHRKMVDAMLDKLGLDREHPLCVRFVDYPDAAHNPWVILLEQKDVDMAKRLWSGQPDPNRWGPWGDREVAVIAPVLLS